MSSSFITAGSGHEKRSKGNSEEPFANRGCARFARAQEKAKKCYATIGANIVCVCVCVR